MVTIESHVNRILRLRVLSDGRRKGFEAYFAFEHGLKPRWWDDAHPPVTGRIIGVYENRKDSARDALVITEEGLTVLHKAEAKSFRFDEVANLMLPRKKPISRSLFVHLRSGAIFEIPIYEPLGMAFTFFRVVRNAVAESRRVAST